MNKNISPIQRIKGTDDISGAEALAWERVESTARDVFQRFAFEPIRTPIIEDLSLFKKSVGEETDIVQKEMFSFERSGTNIALRPEGTASVVRAVIENNLLGDGRHSRKFYYYGPMFRAERPQAGRRRQFNQFGAEIFGSPSPLADVELIEALAALLNALNVTGYSVHLNNIGDFQARQAYSEKLRQTLSNDNLNLCKNCQHRVGANPLRVLDCKVPECQPILDKLPRISEYVSSESTQNFQIVMDLLGRLDIPHKHDFRIVRGLDYYTDIVFEVKHSGLGAQDALAAGGRYNGLVRQLGGKDVPAAGFALGMERLLMVMQNNERESVKKSLYDKNAVAVLWHGEESKTGAYMLLSRLRRSEFKCFMDFDGSSFKSQMRQADDKHAGWVVMIGEEETGQGSIKLKNMQTGHERSINADQFLHDCKLHLKEETHASNA